MLAKVSRFSFVSCIIWGLISLLLHIYAVSGVWAGVPYKADVMVYPHVWWDRWSVGFMVGSVVFLFYGFLLNFMKVSEDIDGAYVRFLANGKS